MKIANVSHLALLTLLKTWKGWHRKRALCSCLGGVAGSNLSEFIPNILKRELYPYMYIYIFLSIHDLIASNSVQSKLQGLTINKKYMGSIRSCFMDILLKKLTIN